MKKKIFVALIVALCPVMLVFTGCFKSKDPTYETGINLATTFETTGCENLDIDVGYRLAFVNNKYGNEYTARSSYYTETPKDISGELALKGLCFEDLKTAKQGYELKDMIIYFDINNNSEYPIAVDMEVTNEVSANFTFDCESIGYIQEKDAALDVKTQTAAFRIRYKNDKSVKEELKDVRLKLTFEKLTPIADTEDVFGYTFDSASKTAVVSSYNDTTGLITDVKIPRTVVNDDDSETYIVTELGSSLFAANEVIEKVYLPDTLKTIGMNAFVNTNKLETVYLTDGIEEIGFQSFAKSVIKGDLYLPESLKDFVGLHPSLVGTENEIRQRGFGAFMQMPAIDKIVIPEGVTELPMQAFASSSIKEIILPTTINLLRNIKYNASIDKLTSTFLSCANLEEIDLYHTSGDILAGQGVFESTGLKRVYLSDSIINLGVNTFRKCYELEYVRVSKNLKVIDVSGFYHCKKLVEIDLPEGLEQIGYAAFENCNALSKIEIPDGVEFIADAAFNHCYSAANATIKIPANIKQIGGFSYNPENPDTEVIGSHVFYNCATESLKAFKIDSSNPYYMAIDGVLYRKESGAPTVMVAYPSAKQDEVYVMPNTVVDAYELSLSRPYYLKEIVLSDSFVIKKVSSDIYANADWANNLSAMIYIYNGVTKVTCNDTNQNYKSVNGQVYSKDGKTLYFASIYTENDGETMTFAEGVETFFAGSLANDADNADNRNTANTFDDDKYLYRYDYVVIPETVSLIEDITLSAINKQSWEITIDPNNLFYKVNALGDIELLEAE